MENILPILSSIELEDIELDTIQSINGVPLDNVTAAQLVCVFPWTFYFDNTTLGVKKLCTCRIDGKPLDIVATNKTVSGYTPEIATIRLFGGRRRPRPVIK